MLFISALCTALWHRDGYERHQDAERMVCLCSMPNLQHEKVMTQASQKSKIYTCYLKKKSILGEFIFPYWIFRAWPLHVFQTFFYNRVLLNIKWEFPTVFGYLWLLLWGKNKLVRFKVAHTWWTRYISSEKESIRNSHKDMGRRRCRQWSVHEHSCT